MGLDIRLPIGGMFGILGVLLVIYGLITNSSGVYTERSLGININLWWGLVMAIFGGLMLFFGTRKKPAAGPTGAGPAVEARRPGGH